MITVTTYITTTNWYFRWRRSRSDIKFENQTLVKTWRTRWGLRIRRRSYDMLKFDRQYSLKCPKGESIRLYTTILVSIVGKFKGFKKKNIQCPRKCTIPKDCRAYARWVSPSSWLQGWLFSGGGVKTTCAFLFFFRWLQPSSQNYVCASKNNETSFTLVFCFFTF